MIDREKVIKGLELCRYDPDPGMPLKSEVSCDICPYWDDTYGCRMNDMFDDAIALLKAQEPRVLTLGEARGSLKQPIWKETRSSHKDLYTGWVLVYDIQTGQGITGTRLGMAEPSGRVVWYRLEDYGAKWRCWTSRPTDEQREEVKWE